MFRVVVDEPQIRVAGERSLTEQDSRHCLVRTHVPGPWRKDMSETLISYATRIVTDEFDDRECPTPVHALGASA
ncbi:hypothetical protein [Nocardia sp. NPDC003345]